MYYNSNTELFLNGQWLKANEAVTDLFSQTLHYGNGVFEGIRAYETDGGTLVFKARAHYERLHYSAQKMHIKLPYTVEELVKITYELLERNKFKNAYIRPLVYLGANMSLTSTNEVHVLITAWEWGRYLGNKPLEVMVSSYRKSSPKALPVEAKITGHYTNSILATTEAKNKGFDEALLLDHDGFVAEGPGANFFYEKDEVLYTPPKGGIMAGITRNTIIEYAREMGYKVEEALFRPEDVYEADAAFFTGTAVEVARIHSLDGHEMRAKWEDTLAYSLHLVYLQRVRHAEFYEFTLV